MLLLLELLFSLMVFAFSESYGIQANAENVELPGELRELLVSSPSVLRELRQVALQDDSDAGFESEKESSRWKKSSETDQQLAFAVASSVFKDFHSQDSLKNKDASWIGETIRFVSKILDCRVDVLNPYIKKCSYTEQKTTRSGMISCSVSSNNSVGCPPCPISSANINLQSPNFPNDYGGPWDCQYLLEAAIGERINLVFIGPFVVENFYDFVTICDGNTTNCQFQVASFSGYKIPGNFIRKYNKLWLKFLADDSNLALPDGKTGQWQISASALSPLDTTTTSTTTTQAPTTTTTTQAPTTTSITTTTSLPPFVHCTADPGCGSCLNITLNGGTIRSSNYPNDNLDNLNCKIIIEAAPNAKILLTFIEFVVEEDYDFVVIYDSSYRMLREELTGFKIPTPFNVKTNNVTINFQTDENNWGLPNFGNGNTGRWALNFTVIYPTTSTIQESTDTSSTSTELYTASTVYPGSLGYTCTAECGVCSSLTPTGGIIQSPNYPADYGNNRNCKIIIDTGLSRSRITLDFIEFNVEQDYDFISVFDANQKQFKNISGYTLPDSTVLKTQRLVVQFNSDENNLGIFSNLGGRWKANFDITPSTITTTATTTTTTSTPATTTTSTQATTTTSTQATTTTSLGTTTPNPNPPTSTVTTNRPIVITNFPLNLLNYTSSGGVVQSPNYPLQYPFNNRIGLNVKVQENKRLFLTWNTFVVDNSSVVLIQAKTPTQTFVGIYRGSYGLIPLPYTFPINSNLSILFTTGSGVDLPADKGPGRWQATFTAVD